MKHLLLLILLLIPIVNGQLVGTQVYIDNEPSVISSTYIAGVDSKDYHGVIGRWTVSLFEDGEGYIVLDRDTFYEDKRELNNAMLIARKHSDNKADYNFFIDSSFHNIKGSSGSASLALAAYCGLEGLDCSNILVTGDLGEDGSIRTVYGMYQKALAAQDYGIEKMFIPAGTDEQLVMELRGNQLFVKQVSLQEEFDMDVIEIETFEEIIADIR